MDAIRFEGNHINELMFGDFAIISNILYDPVRKSCEICVDKVSHCLDNTTIYLGPGSVQITDWHSFSANVYDMETKKTRSIDVSNLPLIKEINTLEYTSSTIRIHGFNWNDSLELTFTFVGCKCTAEFNRDTSDSFENDVFSHIKLKYNLLDHSKCLMDELESLAINDNESNRYKLLLAVFAELAEQRKVIYYREQLALISRYNKVRDRFSSNQER